MTIVQPTADEVGACGKSIYERIRNTVEPGNIGRFVSIDIESGDYSVADDHRSAVDDLRRKHTDAVIYTKRIGFAAVTSFGGRIPREKREPV